MSKSIDIIKQTNTQILGILNHHSKVLARIQTDFHTMVRARAIEGNNGDQFMIIICFYEELSLSDVGEVLIPASFSLYFRDID